MQLKLRKKKNSCLALSLAGITIGGLTITNFVKVFIPVFLKKIFLEAGKNWEMLFSE
jgi:uncharacterized protein YqhQ